MKNGLSLCSAILLVSPISVAASEEYSAEMVVTATRVEEEKLDLPLAIDKLDTAEIDRDHGSHISESLNSIAGVRINQLSAGTSPGHNTAIRMPLNYGPYYLFLQDGVPLQSPGSFNHNALWWSSYSTSVGSIEVLKGAGTALYGSDAVAGTVNVISEAPSQTAEKTVSVSLGENAYRKLKAGISNTTENGHGYRLAASFEEGDGWREKADYRRGEVLFRHEYTNSDEQSFKTIFTANTLSGHNQSALSLAQLEADPSQHGFADPSIDPYRETQSVRLSTEWTSYPSDRSELSLTPYVTHTTNDYVATWVPDTLPENESVSDTLGLLAKWSVDHHDRSETIMGIDLVANRVSRLYVQKTADTVVWGKTYLQGDIYNYDVDYVGLAPYLQHKRHLTEQVTLSAGLRYDYAEFDYDNKLSDGAFGVYQRPADKKDSFSHLSPKLALTYKLSNHSAIYGRYARAFRVPQISTLYALKTSNTLSSLDPETADSYELGYKMRTEQLALELAAYVMKIKDAIVTDASDPGATFKTNAGSITHQGIEASLAWQVNKAFAFDIAYAFPSSEYDDFVSNGSDFSGNNMKMAPERIGNVRLLFTPASVKGVSAELEWQDIGSWWMDDANTKKDGGYDIFNLRADYALSERITLNGKILNLTDRDYVSQSDIAWGKERYYPGSPRLIYAGMDFTF